MNVTIRSEQASLICSRCTARTHMLLDAICGACREASTDTKNEEE